MQGESDALKENKSKNYYKLEKAFFKDVNNKLKKYTNNDNIQFLDATLYDTEACIYYKEVNRAKVKVASENCSYHYLDTLSEHLLYNKEPIDNPDLLHYDSLSELRLGEMFIEKLLKLNWLY